MTTKLLQTPVVQASVVVAKHVYEDTTYLVKVEKKSNKDVQYTIYPEGYTDMALVVRIRNVYEKDGYSGRMKEKTRYGFKIYNNMDAYVTLDVQSSFRTQLVEFGMDLDDNDGNPFKTMEYTAKALLNYLGLDQPKHVGKIRKAKK